MHNKEYALKLIDKQNGINIILIYCKIDWIY